MFYFFPDKEARLLHVWTTTNLRSQFGWSAYWIPVSDEQGPHCSGGFCGFAFSHLLRDRKKIPLFLLDNGPVACPFIPCNEQLSTPCQTREITVVTVACSRGRSMQRYSAKFQIGMDAMSDITFDRHIGPCC
jgi:hypothetical protein